MPNDYVPKSPNNQKTFLEALKAGITTDATACGRTAAQVTADTAFVDSLLTPVTDAVDKSTAAMEATGLARLTMSSQNVKLRQLINGYKASPGWNDGMAEAWQVNTLKTNYDMTTQAPTIRVETVGGLLVVRGQKPGFTSMSIDMRLAGTPSWTTIGVKLSQLPFIDTTAPQTPGKPEKREYRARGHVNDQEMGQPSDIVTAVYNP